MVGAIGEVSGVRILTRDHAQGVHPRLVRVDFRVKLVGDLMLEATHGHPKTVVDRAHPLSVPASKVIVHRDDVDALVLQGIEIRRQGSHKGLAFTRAHLGDLPIMEHHAADELHIEVSKPDIPPCSLSHGGKGDGQ